jgi:hypothetical protein
LNRVGYVPYSINLLHPADRRRLAKWAAEKQIELNTSNPLDSDVLVLSNAANFGYWLKRAKQPVILDLVDGYLGENPSFLKDVARNIVRSLQGLSSIRWITYTRHLRYACKESQAVIVASPEQKEFILKLNNNVHVILDDHSEIDSAIVSASQEVSNEHKPYIFWEGFGFTLKHFKFMAPELDRFLGEFNWGMNLVTVEEFPRWGGYIGKVQTKDVVKSLFPKSWKSIKIIPWSLNNLAKNACESSFAIIPISPHDQFANLKSENKLLSMWHLRMPTLTSPTPSYKRVLSTAGKSEACVMDGDWYERLSSLAISPVDRKELASSGTAYVLTNHTLDKLVKKWDEIIKITLHETKI